jgi:hypothetical protein
VVPSRRFGTAHSSGRTHDFHNAPSTKPSTATASVAIGCCFRDLSIAPLTLLRYLSGPVGYTPCLLGCAVVRPSARSATFRTWSVALSLRSDLRSVLPPDCVLILQTPRGLFCCITPPPRVRSCRAGRGYCDPTRPSQSRQQEQHRSCCAVDSPLLVRNDRYRFSLAADGARDKEVLPMRGVGSC